MVEIVSAFEQNPWRNWVGGKMITESRDTIDEGKKGWSKRKPRGEYSQLLSTSNKRGEGERRAVGIVPMVYIYRSKSSFSLSLPFSTCVLCDCASYTINLKSFVPQLSTFSREREISSSPEEREYLTLYTITCSMITDLCYCSSKFS